MKKISVQIKDIFQKADRTGWQLLKFSDIAENISERVNPGNTDAKIYVGLEHLDPDSIHIRRYGTPSDVKGVKLRVYKGDIIFGKRRAYQRKAGISEFNGICSAHSMVIRAKPENMIPEFFPFFIHSDIFMNRAVEISEGSLSPTIKWKILAQQEFRIPPKSVQEKISVLLWAADALRENHLKLLKSQETVFTSWFSDRLSQISKGKKQILGSVLLEKPKYGASLSAVPYKEGMPRYVRITDVDVTGKLKPEDMVTIGTYSYQKYLLSDQDILIARTADPGKCFLYENEYGPCVYAGYLIKFKLDPKKMLPKFFYLYSKSATYLLFINSTKRTGTLSNINAEEFQSMLIPVIDIVEQKSLIEESRVFEEGLVTQKEAADSTSFLIRGIINELLI